MHRLLGNVSISIYHIFYVISLTAVFDCSQNPLPGYPNLERFCSLLVDIGLVEDKLSLVTEQRNAILVAWTKVEDHDKRQQQFNELYRTHWGNTLYCRTKRHNLVDAAVIQRVKMGIRYAPAQQERAEQ